MEQLLSFITAKTLIYALFVLVALLLIAYIRVEVKLSRLLRGRDGKSLEGAIKAVHTGQKDLEAFRREVEKYLETVEKRLRRSVQRIETIRFNPFKGTGSGGNQSFSTAFLNEDGDGVIISTLYARERTSVYSKPVEKFASTYELSQEEREALLEAKKHITAA
ncbi:hypothetical protein COU17_00685 [Candidatus Kaiserbacteria bacterium CG10_big_fil_rev_8_21_14_0_10_49_17]|uniref:DUF4446 domain-containing protein n=1 Tax=Candidatus Kaiserbacteria bacterium CG10_big_fil_rev_8_21_14_0_10_49_17 TaxID=1974609 RepID=A0A2M6WFB6_9BACT|nr:MAG: hypothetical protein COU17_00685 [Candidatus Kaiserbacteria bacterium CG10_big_fil_rev_8_21_14_0_10_49_17]